MNSFINLSTGHCQTKEDRMLRISKKRFSLIFSLLLISQISRVIACDQYEESNYGEVGYSHGSMAEFFRQVKGIDEGEEYARFEPLSNHEEEAEYIDLSLLSLREGKVQRYTPNHPPHPAWPVSSPPFRLTLNSAVPNQGFLGTCASFSVIRLLQFEHSSLPLSQPYLITSAERLHNCFNDGIPLHLGMQVAKSTGVVEYKWWPYETYTRDVISRNRGNPDKSSWNMCLTPPAVTEYQKRFAFRTTENLFSSVRGAIKSQILRAALDKYKRPISLAVFLNPSDWAKTSDIASFTGKEDKAHAITICGYNDNGFIFENSWGPLWGNKGYGTMSDAYVSVCAFDAWLGYGTKILPPFKVSPPLPRVSPTPLPIPSLTSISTMPRAFSLPHVLPQYEPIAGYRARYSEEDLYDILHPSLRSDMYYVPEYDYPDVWRF